MVRILKEYLSTHEAFFFNGHNILTGFHIYRNHFFLSIFKPSTARFRARGESGKWEAEEMGSVFTLWYTLFPRLSLFSQKQGVAVRWRCPRRRGDLDPINSSHFLPLGEYQTWTMRGSVVGNSFTESYFQWYQVQEKLNATKPRFLPLTNIEWIRSGWIPFCMQKLIPMETR